MGSMIDFARPDGDRTKGYLAIAGQGRPGVVVIQEWWGLNDQICGVADRFARAGYDALAPDLYKGRLTTEVDEANHLMTGLDFAEPQTRIARSRAIPKDTKRQSGGDGVLHGRSMTIAAAVHVPESDAAVCFYAYRPRILPTPQRSECRCRAISPTRTTGDAGRCRRSRKSAEGGRGQPMRSIAMMPLMPSPTSGAPLTTSAVPT